MWWESHRKAEPCIRSGAVLPNRSSEEERGTPHRTSKWKGRMANLLLGIPDRQQKKFAWFLISVMPETWRGQKVKKEVEERAARISGPRPGTYSDQEPNEKSEHGWWWTCHQGGEYHLRSANSNRHHCDKKNPKHQTSACEHQTTASHILLHTPLQSCKMMGTAGIDTKSVPTGRWIRISFTSLEARLLHKLPETLASRPKSTYSANSINVIIKSQYI